MLGTLAALGLAFITLPLLALITDAPWSSLVRSVTSPEARAALRLSLMCSIGATVVATALGLPLAWVFARVPFRGRSFAWALVMVPMVLPPVVAGVGLLAAFGRRGLLGGFLADGLGVQLTFSPAGVVLAEAFVALPFLVVTVEAALRASGTDLEEAARTLGARPWTVLRRITLPAVAPALGAGAALAWARALGEFGATITFAGNIEGRTRTVPLAVYLLLDREPAVATALSLVMLAVSVGVLTALRGRWLGRAA
ncbi:MAG: ABC transporter permease [Actinomycetota bacterium]